MARPRPKRSTLPDGSVVVAGKRPNSTASAYFVASRGVWRATWIDPTTGRRRSVSRATRAEAERRAAEAATRAAATVTRPLGADPDTTIDQVAAWWLDNVAAPEVRPPTLHAYRKDVARLSERLARERWDRLVALAPNPQVGIVTSEPLTAVEVDRDSIVVCTATSGEVTITGEGLDNDHLDYGYALTIHRAQGAIHDRSHVLAAGGGRELGYVAMSRARDGTTIHSTADDLAQAVDYLQADWTDTPAANAEHLERIHARGAEHATGLDRGLGL